MVLTQPNTLGDILKYDLDANYTRESVTLLAGTDYKIGSVLGKVTASGKYKLATATGSDGAQTASAILLEPANAADGDVTAVVLARGPAIVVNHALIFDATVDDATKKAAKVAQILSAGIVTRDAV